MGDGGMSSGESEAIGYSFDEEGRFTGAYSVDTGKDIPGAGFVSEYGPEGKFSGGYGLTSSKASQTGVSSDSPGGGGGISKEGQPVGLTPGEQAAEEPSAYIERKEAQKAGRRRRRRSLISEDEPGGLLAPATLRRPSLLSV